MTYNYTCTKCEHNWEEEQKITAPVIETCPACGEKTAKRLISGGTGFILSGGGWASSNYSK
jgi:putative FmdB family regulatory protein